MQGRVTRVEWTSTNGTPPQARCITRVDGGDDRSNPVATYLPLDRLRGSGRRNNQTMVFARGSIGVGLASKPLAHSCRHEMLC